MKTDYTAKFLALVVAEAGRSERPEEIAEAVYTHVVPDDLAKSADAMFRVITRIAVTAVLRDAQRMAEAGMKAS